MKLQKELKKSYEKNAEKEKLILLMANVKRREEIKN